MMLRCCSLEGIRVLLYSIVNVHCSFPPPLVQCTLQAAFVQSLRGRSPLLIDGHGARRGRMNVKGSCEEGGRKRTGSKRVIGVQVEGSRWQSKQEEAA